MTPTQASVKKIEGFAYNNFLDKRKVLQTKFQVNDLVRVADLRKTFPKGDTTNWPYKLYEKLHEYLAEQYQVKKMTS